MPKIVARRSASINLVIYNKIFRALFVDRGGTLIPWMGDPNQPIDRYDGRATIHNLEPFEACKNNLEPKDYLTAEEVSYLMI